MTLIMTKFHQKSGENCVGKIWDARRRWVFREEKNREQIKKAEKYGLAWEAQADQFSWSNRWPFEGSGGQESEGCLWSYIGGLESLFLFIGHHQGLHLAIYQVFFQIIKSTLKSSCWLVMSIQEGKHVLTNTLHF